MDKTPNISKLKTKKKLEYAIKQISKNNKNEVNNLSFKLIVTLNSSKISFTFFKSFNDIQ